MSCNAVPCDQSCKDGDGQAQSSRDGGQTSADGDGPPPPPPPTLMDIAKLYKARLQKAWNDAYKFWRSVRDDRYKFEMFKSIIYYTLGLKLFNDLARHLNPPKPPCGSELGFKQCQGGAECIRVQNCTGLYSQVQQQGLTPELTRLLNRLRCGFDENTPLICCPPEFAGTTNLESRVRPQASLPGYDVCGIHIDEKIVGGTRADIDEHPWMALLRYDKPKGWGFHCGGVLISPRYVMSAAHCVKGKNVPPNWRLSQVRLGEWNTSSTTDCVDDDCAEPVQDIPIEQVIPHEEYNPDEQNDILLLRLSRNVQYNDFVKPICLPTDSALKRNSFVGFDMEVAGWGKTESQSVSDVKLKVRVPVVNLTECSNAHDKMYRPISNKQLCAGGVSGQDSCKGDSGGALMVSSVNNWIAVGVVSYGPKHCGTRGKPAVYTRVDTYVDWIQSKIQP